MADADRIVTLEQRISSLEAALKVERERTTKLVMTYIDLVSRLDREHAEVTKRMRLVAKDHMKLMQALHPVEEPE
jgi:BMFP domain-containing protein YqiC